MEAGALFRRLLGAAFDSLPAEIREVHARPALWRGRCRVSRGGALAAFAARVMSLPPAGMHDPMQVRIDAFADGEAWTREIGGATMRSRLRESDGLLCESMGPATFRFVLRCVDGAIVWRLRSVRMLGMPVPARLFDVRARESVLDGRYRFEVSAAIAGLGPIVAYDGMLDRRS